MLVITVQNSLFGYKVWCLTTPLGYIIDGVGHNIERNSTQIRCAVCHMKVYKSAMCDVSLHIDCFVAFHTR